MKGDEQAAAETVRQFLQALVDKDYATLEREVGMVVGLAHANEAIVKVILECAYLDDAQKAIAAQLPGVKMHIPTRMGQRYFFENGRVTGIETVECRSVFDAAGRFNPAFAPGTELAMAGDTVILAIGQRPEISYAEPLLETRRGLILVNPDSQAASQAVVSVIVSKVVPQAPTFNPNDFFNFSYPFDQVPQPSAPQSQGNGTPQVVGRPATSNDS